MGYAYANPDGTYSMQLTPSQSVRIAHLFQDESTLTPYDGFYGGTNSRPREFTALVPKIHAEGTSAVKLQRS